MWQDIFNLAINNGLWAVLFLVLLFYVLRDSRSREKKYQDTIEKLGKSLSCIEGIQSDVEEIKVKIGEGAIFRTKKQAKGDLSEEVQ